MTSAKTPRVARRRRPLCTQSRPPSKHSEIVAKCQESTYAGDRRAPALEPLRPVSHQRRYVPQADLHPASDSRLADFDPSAATQAAKVRVESMDSARRQATSCRSEEHTSELQSRE